MPQDFSELRRDIVFFLASLKSSVDRPLQASLLDPAQRDRITRTMLLVEEARIRFNSATRFRTPSPENWELIKSELLSFVDRFLTSDQFDPGLHDKMFRLSASPTRERKSLFFQQLSVDRFTIFDAIISFRSFITQATTEEAPSQQILDFERLETIIPSQQVAPVQFEVSNGKISVAKRSSRAPQEDQKNIDAALDHIRSNGEKLIENLQNSNCDRRLLDSIAELQHQLAAQENVVKIGLTNMACSIMHGQFQNELPSAISGMFISYSTSISLYVAQFPEWERFAQKAAQLEIEDHDIYEVDRTAGALIETLRADPNLADPDVPKTIEFVRQFLAFPGSSAKRAAFAMIRTVENLVSSILRHSLDFFDKTTQKTVDNLSSATAKTIVALLGVALIGASGIGSAAIRAGAPWVKQAAEIVQKHIEKVPD